MFSCKCAFAVMYDCTVAKAQVCLHNHRRAVTLFLYLFVSAQHFKRVHMFIFVELKEFKRRDRPQDSRELLLYNITTVMY